MLPPGTQPGLTRGSGQPINQPMVPGSGPSGTWTPQDAARFTQKSGPMPASGGGFISQPMGSLQSLGGGQLNQSGMGRRAPIYQLGNRAMPSKQQAMLKALLAQMMGR
jgi:hypothetical protein